jgi:ribosomal protein S18 acetylase RimI-like enzyme
MPPCDEVFHIRRARHDDAPGIGRVHVATWRDAYREMLPPAFLNALSVDQRAEWWARELKVLPAERQPWVAETPSGIVGFVSSGPARDESLEPSTGEIYAIYVLADCWDRGLGKTLLVHAERDLLEHGYTEAVLWCLADNNRARGFYEALDWQPDGATKVDNFAGHAAAEVRYRTRLDRSRVS